MNIAFLSRNFILTTINVLIGIPLFICLTLFLVKKKVNRVKSSIILLMFITIFSMLPFDKIINVIPFKLNTVEEAVKFDFENEYQIVYKKKYKNTYFIIGKPTRHPNDIWLFASYKQTKNGLKSLVQPPNLSSLKYKRKNSYEIHYFNNKEDNVTGIFIESSESANAKGGLNENSKILDNYNTKFTYVKSKKGVPLQRKLVFEHPLAETKKITKSYIYFGIGEHNMKDDYYLEIDEEKMVLKDLKDSI